MPNLLKSNKLKKSIVIAKKNRSMSKKARPMSKKGRPMSKKGRPMSKKGRPMSKKVKSKGKKTRSISKRVRSKLPSKKTYQHGGVSFTFSNAIKTGSSINVETSGIKFFLDSNKVNWIQPGNKKVISIELLINQEEVDKFELEMVSLSRDPLINNIELFDLGDKSNNSILKSIFREKTELSVADAGCDFINKYNNIFSETPPDIRILAVTEIVNVEFKDDDGNKIEISSLYKKITAGVFKIIFLPPTEDKIIAIELITSHKKNQELMNERVISNKMSEAGIGPKIYYSNTFDLSNKDNETSLKNLFGGKNKLDQEDYEAGGAFIQAYNNIFSPENEDSRPEIKLLAITIMMKLDNFRDYCFYPSLANNIQTMWGVDSKSRQFDSKKLTKDECKQIFKSLKTKFNTLWDKYHIAHHDINHNNLMYKRHPDGTVEGFIIDWGWAKDYSETGEDAYKKEFDYQATGVVGEDFLKLFRGKGDGDAFRLKPGFRYHEL